MCVCLAEEIVSMVLGTGVHNHKHAFGAFRALCCSK